MSRWNCGGCLLGLLLATQPGCKKPVESMPAAGSTSAKLAVDANAPPPKVPEKLVLVPIIHAKLQEYGAGTAFAVKHPDFPRPILLTCCHIFGTTGGYPVDIPAQDIPATVKALTFQDKYTGTDYLERATRFIPLPQARSLGEASPCGDIVALWTPEPWSLGTVPLSAADPPAGSPVWLASRTAEEREPPRRLHRAIVIGVRDGLLEYRFDDSAIKLRATSGAPILNAAGEAVAIHLGGGTANGGLLGVGNPVSVFEPHLKAAAARGP